MSEETDRTIPDVSNLDKLRDLLNRLDREEQETDSGIVYVEADVYLDRLPTFGGDRPRGRPCEGQPDSYADGLLPFSWDETRVLICPDRVGLPNPWEIMTREAFREEILDGMLPDLWVEEQSLKRRESDVARDEKIRREVRGSLLLSDDPE